MTIRLTLDELWERHLQKAEENLQWDSSDKLDTTYHFDTQIAQGWQREIFLREGIFLKIYSAQQCDQLLIDNPEKDFQVIRCSFALSGNEHKLITFKPNEITIPLTAGKYYIRSNGLLPHVTDYEDTKPRSLIAINVSPQVLSSFVASSERELPQTLQHLVKSSR
ncbi:MAG: hypothetical protein F6J97_25500, partial [Leptolyngbya sp. SIO4C1]|nr:hypothetical protein [Leptolyngbya sp. SIO4C1]